MTYNIAIEKNGISGCGAYDTPSTTLNVIKFDTLKEARKEVRRMIKEEGYIKGYYVYNLELGTELRTNF